jgi:hypothetical protein
MLLTGVPDLARSSGNAGRASSPTYRYEISNSLACRLRHNTHLYHHIVHSEHFGYMKRMRQLEGVIATKEHTIQFQLGTSYSNSR